MVDEGATLTQNLNRNLKPFVKDQKAGAHVLHAGMSDADATIGVHRQFSGTFADCATKGFPCNWSVKPWFDCCVKNV